MEGTKPRLDRLEATLQEQQRSLDSQKELALAARGMREDLDRLGTRLADEQRAVQAL